MTTSRKLKDLKDKRAGAASSWCGWRSGSSNGKMPLSSGPITRLVGRRRTRRPAMMIVRCVDIGPGGNNVEGGRGT